MMCPYQQRGNRPVPSRSCGFYKSESNSGLTRNSQTQTRLRMASAVAIRRHGGPRFRSGRLRQRQRSLDEHVAPAFRSAHIRVAEPQLVVEFPVVLGAFDPQECGYDRGIAPHADRLLELFLMLVGGLAGARVFEQVLLGVGLSATGH